ncbi:hypothetical protein [Nitrosomonas communis]|uniref:Uncharacterized protein n=1 Tax=Nitrosomonas communis TaxID=44574 RepID=A0A1I4UWF7_9PROT|nr:hypothetical protein [Nitrosomonas communis]SFM93281.1 hypothetical protein SAMN05421863_10723 [Nitrosomonas communis]
MNTIAIFCASDDFCKEFEPCWDQRLSGVIAETVSVTREAVSK